MPGEALVAIALMFGAVWLWPGPGDRRTGSAPARGSFPLALGSFPLALGRFPLALGVLLLAALAHVAAYDSLQDDAFISFRYARQLAEGHGLVFNVGERVEGYSNFALVVLLAGAHALLGADIVQASIAIGVLAAAGTLLVVYLYARDLAGGERGIGLLAALAVAGAACFAAYARSGLETTLFCGLVVAALRQDGRGAHRGAGVLAALATWTRPDGVIVAAALACAALAERPVQRARLGALALGYGALIVPWTAWRLLYYGHFVPNQVAAKTGMDPVHQLGLGFQYLGRALVANAPLVLLGVVALAALALGRRRAVSGRGDVALGVAFTGSVAFAVATGGDWMPAYRMLVPAIVLGAIGVARLYSCADFGERWRPDRRPAAALFAAAAAASVVIGAHEPRMLPAVDMLREIVDGEEDVGRWLGRRLPPDTTIAAWANGAIPYHSRLPTIDLLGLTDEHIARSGQRRREGQPGHIAFDHEYVIARRPEVVTFLGGDGLAPAPSRRMFEAYSQAYVPLSFAFSRRNTPAIYANVWVLASERERLAEQLADPEFGVALVPGGKLRQRRAGP